jgi:hypothetical protein
VFSTARAVARGRQSHARRLLSAVLAGTLVCLAGCQAHQAGRSAPAKSGTTASDGSLVAGLTLPVLAYVPSPALRQEVTAAEGLVAARCLQKYGLHWSANIPTGMPHPASELDREYGISDPQAAGRYGYHLPPGHDYAYRLAVPQSGAVAAALQGLDDADRPIPSIGGKAVPQGGCLGQARNQVGGPALEDSTADIVLLSASQQANRDPQVIALFRQWSACMATAGYRYPDPLAAIGSSQWTSDAISAAEIHTALADLACKRQLQMLPKWVAIESGYERTLIARDRGVLDATIQAWNQAGVRAHDLLAGD